MYAKAVSSAQNRKGAFGIESLFFEEHLFTLHVNTSCLSSKILKHQYAIFLSVVVLQHNIHSLLVLHIISIPTYLMDYEI